MKTQFLISLLCLSAGVFSWKTDCWTSSCRNSYNYCYAPSCGFTRYCLNPDYFTFYFKDSVKDFRLKKDEFRSELQELAAENQEDMDGLRAELQELKANIKDNIAHMKEQVNELAAKFNAERAQLEAERQSAWDEMRASWKSSRQVAKEWRNAHNELRTDIDSLRAILTRNRGDRARALLLRSVDGCDDDCSNNYVLLYSTWKTVVLKLRTVLVSRLASSPCEYKRKRMRYWFDQYCAPYPKKVVLRLRKYYSYLVHPKVCEW